MKIVVIGGTGLIGSKIVPILRQHGHEVVAASPNTGVNSITGEGVKGAMAGTQVVIDLAGSMGFPAVWGLPARRQASPPGGLSDIVALRQPGRLSWLSPRSGDVIPRRGLPPVT